VIVYGKAGRQDGRQLSQYFERCDTAHARACQIGVRGGKDARKTATTLGAEYRQALLPRSSSESAGSAIDTPGGTKPDNSCAT